MNDLVMELDSHSGRHLYEQIYDHIRREIREGKLLHGEKLPSTRFLASYLQVSRSTVDLAYEQLLSEGYIESRPYKGFFVCKIEELYDLRVSRDSAEGCEDEADRHFLYDFSPNVVEPGSFPFRTWKKITREILTDEKKSQA